MNNIDTLRNRLFDLIGDLTDPEKKVDIERARLTIDAARAITETAKAETDRIRVVGRPADTDFIPVVAAKLTAVK